MGRSRHDPLPFYPFRWKNLFIHHQVPFAVQRECFEIPWKNSTDPSNHTGFLFRKYRRCMIQAVFHFSKSLIIAAAPQHASQGSTKWPSPWPTSTRISKVPIACSEGIVTHRKRKPNPVAVLHLLQNLRRTCIVIFSSIYGNKKFPSTVQRMLTGNSETSSSSSASPSKYILRALSQIES